MTPTPARRACWYRLDGSAEYPLRCNARASVNNNNGCRPGRVHFPSGPPNLAVRMSVTALVNVPNLTHIKRARAIQESG